MNKWALVTAGAQGLGLALSRHLLEQGCGVIVHYRSSAAAAEALAAEFGTHRVCAVQADLATRAGRARFVAAVREQVGQLHVLLNNLGVYPETALLDTDVDDWEEALALNCTAAFYLIQTLHPLMHGAAGRIINIGDSSVDRIEGHTEATAYFIAKYGLHVLTRSYAPLLMPYGITVNMISPGWLQNSVGPSDPELPGKRRGSFRDVIGALDYLLSDAACYVSGANIVVSGAFNVVRN